MKAAASSGDTKPERIGSLLSLVREQVGSERHTPPVSDPLPTVGKDHTPKGRTMVQNALLAMLFVGLLCTFLSYRG